MLLGSLRGFQMIKPPFLMSHLIYIGTNINERRYKQMINELLVSCVLTHIVSTMMIIDFACCDAKY